MTNKSFYDTVRERHSCRSFLSDEIPQDLITRILRDAQCSPSNCNTQPWHVHIVTGGKKKKLSEKLIFAHEENLFNPDFTFDTNAFSGIYKQRMFAQGKAYYEGLGITRDDKEGRNDANLRNYNFYNAPCVALLFMPVVGDCVRVAADIGMYAQTFLLSLTAHGLAGVPQTVLGFYPDIIRKHLDISEDYKMLFGISFGYEDESSDSSNIKMGRDSFTTNVTFH